jgi:hypothetical protein
MSVQVHGAQQTHLDVVVHVILLCQCLKQKHKLELMVHVQMNTTSSPPRTLAFPPTLNCRHEITFASASSSGLVSGGSDIFVLRGGRERKKRKGKGGDW